MNSQVNLMNRIWSNRMKRGRPKLKKSERRVHITASVNQDSLFAIENYALKNGVSRGAAIDALLLKATEEHSKVESY